MCKESFGKLRDTCGTQNYKPPQKNEGKEYLGGKSDIFSLGCLLYFLMVRQESFKIADKEDSLYNLVYKNQKESFFKLLHIESFNSDFKDLYYSMIAYNEKDRPTLDEILESKWLDEINNMKKEMMDQLEQETKKEILEKREVIDNVNPSYLIKLGYRSSTINKEFEMNKKDYEKEYFKKNNEVKHTDIDLEGEIYIKINGDFNYWDYMNCYVNKIKNEEKCEISDYGDSYKCNIVYKEKDGENEDLIIKLKLYKIGVEEEEEYLLRFLRISGSLSDYYEKVNIIHTMGKNLLKEKYI